jgi:hypothetical protein
MVTKASIENSKGFSYHDDYQGPQIINKRESFETCGWIGHALDEASGWFFSQVINFLRCIMIFFSRPCKACISLRRRGVADTR